MSSQELVEEFYKQIIWKFEKRIVYALFIDSIWGTDLVNMKLLRKLNKRIRFYYMLLIFINKYAWIIPLKDKNGVTVTKLFEKILDEPNRKPNKIWVDKGSESYNISVKSWLQDNGLKMYSTRNEK